MDNMSDTLCEIDSPEHSKSSVKKYIYFWNKQGYKHLAFSYIQPSLSPSQESVNGLWFTVANLSNNNISGNYVLKVIYDYMKYAMQIDGPYKNCEFQKMKQELSNCERIDTLSII